MPGAFFRRNSVLLTVIAAFTITLVSITYTFWEFYQNNRRQYIDNIFTKYSVIAQIYRDHLINHTSEPMLEANLAVYGLSRIEEGADAIVAKAKVLKQAGFQEVLQTAYRVPLILLMKQRISNLSAAMLEADGRIYFHIESQRGTVLLYDETLRPYFPTQLLSAYLTIVFVLALAIFMILARIRPLRRLTKKVRRYAEGDREVSFKMRGLNEIAVLANELEAARRNINTLIESRTLFLRNLMHELKTPIAKGRIVAEMVPDPKQKSRFSGIFIRLEQLINEFALIEQVSSGFGPRELGECRLVDVIDEALDQSMAERERVEIVTEPGGKIRCDFAMMATAVKNMIDNGIKYGTDHKVRIVQEGAELRFESLGEKLAHPLSYYVAPFSKEHPARDSFGLGLYLVDAILAVHGMLLAYEHRDGVNIFIFEPEPKALV